MVVNFEVDAFDPSLVGEETLSQTFDALTTTPGSISAPSRTLNVLRGGRVISQSSLIELKSSAKTKWQETYPQLCLSQTPWLYAASHKEGHFNAVKKIGLGSPEVAEVAENFKVKFSRLRDALRTIKDIVIKAGPEGRLSFVVEDKELKVYVRQGQDSSLPLDAMALFS